MWAEVAQHLLDMRLAMEGWHATACPSSGASPEKRGCRADAKMLFLVEVIALKRSAPR